MRTYSFIILFTFLCSCTTQQISQNFYEGIESRNESLKSTPLETSGGPALSYEEYERERKKLSSPD